MSTARDLLAAAVAMVIAASAACPYPTALPCEPGPESCGEGAYCDPQRQICVALPEGGRSPYADASGDSGELERDGATRDQAGRDQRAADTRHGDTAPADQAEQDGALPDAGPQDSAPVDTLLPDAGSPDSAIPDLHLVDQARPDLLLADQAAPDTFAPDTFAPDTFAADSFVPDTFVPDTFAPDTFAPDTFVPDTFEPDTFVPDTFVPDTFEPDACEPPVGPPWWDPAYAYRHPLSVGAAPADYTVELSLSGGQASTLFGLSQAGGDDLRIVRHAGGSAEDLDRELLAFGSGSMRVRFKIQEGGGGYPGGSDTYFLYIGASSPSAAPADLHSVYLFFDDFESTDAGQDPSGWRVDPAASWAVVDESGNHVLGVSGNDRFIAEIAGNTAQDLSIACRMRSDSGNTNNNGVFFRGTQTAPLSNLWLWYAQLRVNENIAQIGEYQTSKYQSWNSAGFTINTGTWYSIEARVVGSSMEMLVDGTSRVSHSISGAGAEIGLFAYYPNAVYDDVKVRLLSSPEPAVGLGAQQQPCG